MYLNLLLVLIFFACIAFMVNGGLWTNTLVLVNVVAAGLIAFNYFEPLSNWLDGQEKSYTYFWDFLSLWFLFAVAMGVLRSITDLISTVKVKFRAPFDQIGGILMACIVGAVMMSFTLATLHTSPLALNFLAGNFQPRPDSRMFFGLGPDRTWLSFVNMQSHRSFARSGPTAHEFGSSDDYIQAYGARRSDFAKETENRVGTGS